MKKQAALRHHWSEDELSGTDFQANKRMLWKKPHITAGSMAKV